ncbi:hypothetical protein BGZ97_006133 [Linnemannia gamsii]|uniref:Uncharacterized protein n=1 Tax=Linnemannia gamsii TaxID=64522 RepID=A0A9P6QTP1_9FUNG|nr:hypothetical protein BGZ97_006133 [Linnemannia gamsii]
MDAYPDIPIFPALTWIILCNQSSLSHLHLTKCRIKSSTDVLLLIQCISTLSALQHLSAEFEETAVLWGDVVQAFFDSLPTSSLEDLTLTLSSDGHENRAATPLLVHRSNNHGGAETPGPVGTGGLSSPLVVKRRLPLLSRLKRLQIDVRLRRDVRMLGFFLARCPTLELFFPPQACVQPCQFALILISRAIYKYCRRLHVLENGGCATAKILAILPINTLTTLCNDGCWSEEDMATVVHLVSRRQFNSLTEIRIINGSHIKGTHIQAILWSCSVLEHLTIKHQNIAATRLKHLVEKDWACTRLKTLEMTVDLRRVDALACKLSRAGRPMPTVNKNTWMMLKKFYRQLGALTGIEVLNLGIYSKELWWMDSEGRIRDEGEFVATELDWDDDGTWDLADDVTTELTIHERRSHFAVMPDASFPGLLSLGDKSSGRPGYLSWLSGLTNLRELRGHVQATTSETSRTPGQRELEWMMEHWPSLKVIELLPAFDEYGWYRNQVDLSPPHI